MENNAQMMDGLQFVGEAEFGDHQNYQEEYSYNTPKKSHNDYRNDRYNNAYGNYTGGYGPSGGYANLNNFRSSGDFGPPNNFGPSPPFFQEQLGNFSFGQGFGPAGPPLRKNPMDDKTIRYLKRCGVGKEHLKNLPRDLLALIEPEYCGLCAQGLGSNTLSRVHYISKNHLKNQRKWLNLHSQIGFLRNKEVPFKARELYCELCDVHITSTIHSQSHYSGKSHRSIVEGRRNPKNPFLLQQGMEERVEQLIRREKKHLKDLQEDKNEKKEPEKKEAKPISSDLYCEICNTSVTCTDQMTTHMNGKRHLTKEKQHILKMMKGEVKDTDADSKKQQGQDNTEECNTKEGEEKNYDWEEGGEKWEEVSK